MPDHVRTEPTISAPTMVIAQQRLDAGLKAKSTLNAIHFFFEELPENASYLSDRCQLSRATSADLVWRSEHPFDFRHSDEA
jgi:hypothetical protein